MIGRLSKEQVTKLSLDEHELIARLALEEARHRREILAQAKSYRGSKLVPVLLWIVAVGLSVWKVQNLAEMLPFLVIIAFILVQFHAHGVNSRIDAMIRLLDLDNSPNAPSQAEQTLPPNRSEAPPLDSNPSARGSVD